MRQRSQDPRAKGQIASNRTINTKKLILKPIKKEEENINKEKDMERERETEREKEQEEMDDEEEDMELVELLQKNAKLLQEMREDIKTIINE